MTRPLLRAALAALALSTAAVPLLAAPAATTVAPAELAGFVDGVVAEQIAAREVAGAVVTVVQGGKVVLNRGYGHQDLAAGVPVDATRSLFRPGSVSKLITWTALMQQVEAGRVDLDADVNRYLDFTIPPFDGKPATVGNGVMVALVVEEPAKVDKLYKKAMELFVKLAATWPDDAKAPDALLAIAAAAGERPAAAVLTALVAAARR